MKKNSLIVTILVPVLLIAGGIGYVTYGYYHAQKNVLSDADRKTLDRQIAVLTEAIDANPDIVRNYISLSEVYLQKIRQTADSSYYFKISNLLDKATALDPHSAEIPAVRSSVEIGRHHFKEGYEFARQAIALNSNNHLNYGLKGDALIELGQYKEAAEVFQKMVDLRPDYSAYIRIAYIRELYGDTKGAKEALQTAIDSGSSFKENIAFAYVELGKLDMRDSLENADIDFDNALRILPGYPPALEGKGRVAFFKGEYASAEAHYKAAYDKLSIVQYATDLGDLYLRQGDTAKANQYFALGMTSFESSIKSGVDTDLEYSLFLSDHELNLASALEKAKRAYEVRPSIYAADYLSWALYKNARYKEAAMYTKDALRLGETDPLILFHQGLISEANGDKQAAKKYLEESKRINPYFSILDESILQDHLKNL